MHGSHRRRRFPIGGTLSALMLAAPAVFLLGTAAAASASSPSHIFLSSGVSHTTAQSTNWAGWAVTGPKGSVTDVKGSWVVPSIQGSCPASNQYSSFWIGIDGYSSSSVEQTGTDSDCQGGSATYYAWYEFYPHPSFLISSVSVSPGDVISAEVKYASGKFTLHLTDVTTGASFSKSSKVSAARTSAEWIAEAPSSSGGILPLANFGTVRFGSDATSVTSTGTATVSGTTAAIGGFTNTVSINMVNKAGTATKAATGALTPDGTSFNVTWKSAGP